MKTKASPTRRAFLVSGNIQKAVHRIVLQTPIYDIHTHLYDPVFGSLLLWGIDELLVYHYLVAESFRYHRMDYNKFWSLSKTRQADLIWELLFLKNSPISESCRGVVTCLEALGIDARKRDLPLIRKHFARWSTAQYVDRVFQTARIEKVIMTNNPFDGLERPIWMTPPKKWDERFQAALRLDDILMTWEKAVPRLREWGYAVQVELNPKTIGEVRRYLREWISRIKAVYLAVSLPPTFNLFDSEGGSDKLTAKRNQLIIDCVLPECRENGIPFAMMIGVKKLVNPHLRLAGDSVGRADPGVVERMCAEYPKNRFLVTMLSRENQHELCVIARKFHNLHIFGCWWFVNNPSIIEEITRERIELLGLSMTPQHSDARVLDQLIYKWSHFREILARVLTEKYSDIAKKSWPLTAADIERDVKNLFGGAFRSFITSA